jgi:hypothetical protein
MNSIVSGVASRDGVEGRTGDADDVPRKLDDSDLESKADTQERHLLLSRPLGSGDHSLRTTKSKSTGDEDTAASRRA